MGNLDISAALDQLNEIHGQMARDKLYRGYRPLPVAVSGAAGLLGAWLQPLFVTGGDPVDFVRYWLTVAGACAIVAGSAVALHFMRQTPRERRQTLYVWGQFVPCLAAGGLAGSAVGMAMPEAIPLLPGLWAIIFALGIFASRPFLPRAAGWVALYYILAGSWLLRYPASPALPAWGLALVFCMGQFAGALILYLKLERSPLHGEEYDG